MQTFKTLADCVALAEFAHRNQTDQAGMPYIEHPRRVMEAVKSRGCMPYVQMAAILHDVTEDTAFTPDMLLELGVPEPAVEIIKLVDRGYSEGTFRFENNGRDVSLGGRTDKKTWYTALGPDAQEEYYYWHISQNNGASIVKECDIDDNTLPWRVAYLSTERRERLQKKYEKARYLLSPYRNPMNPAFKKEARP